MKKGIIITLLVAFSMMAIGIFLATDPAVAKHPNEEGEKGWIVIDQPAEVWPPAKLDKKTGAKKKAMTSLPVKFSHGEHGKRLGCPTCHHKQPDLKLEDTEAKGCFSDPAGCHGPADVTVEGKVKPNTWKIIHDPKVGQCRSCHKTDPVAIEKKAPTKCKDCHVKKAK